MTEYEELHARAVAMGWRVPITQPVAQEAWYQYWKLREAQANGHLHDKHVIPPDGITFMERVEAHRLGRVKYWTGRECVNDHMAPRYVTSGACSLCVAAAQRRSSFKSPDMVLFRARVHKDDVTLVQDTIQALNAARGL